MADVRRSSRIVTGLGIVLPVLIAMAIWPAFAAPPQKNRKPPKLPDLKTPESKLAYIQMIRNEFPAMRRSTSFTPEDLDKQLEQSVAKGTDTKFVDVVDDETFLRRVSVDLTGLVPDRDQIKKFVADKGAKKREQLIDQLLETGAYSRKWARYWSSVVFFETAANRNSINPQSFEDWLASEFAANRSWDLIVAQMLSAAPQRHSERKPQDNGWEQDHGPNNFILACERKPEVIASQTARLFMGISIGCAECHDHPFDQWKREQFHEMAAFFAPNKYYMTDQYDPAEKSEMQARFLLGEKPPEYLKGDHRRVAMAGYLMYNPDNYWFARAYVNRIWNELVGDGFYSVDSLGPDKEVTHVLVVNRLASAFRQQGFDVKWLFRMILNTRTYQRQIRTLDEEADLFTAVRPARLRPYEVADNLERLVGENGGMRKAIESAFEQNPSVPQRDLEGTMQQALLMMNNSQLHSKLAASSLAKDLSQMKSDEDLIREAFLGVLARTPTFLETARYKQYLQQSQNRQESVEDLLWVLVNSAEFVAKR
ncbi:MAG: DUF1549 domain-containing protein [Planctomycetaceae bacterium]|nr:DUF1549 domain-containing protein [Planctomycetaceae bacterium]